MLMSVWRLYRCKLENGDFVLDQMMRNMKNKGRNDQYVGD